MRKRDFAKNKLKKKKGKCRMKAKSTPIHLMGYAVLLFYGSSLPCIELILGLAPKMARFTLAFLPSIIGFGSLQAFSAASFVVIIT